ncbi:MAG TPA: TlpA disulfide reductase family protein [Terriglobia bacterium]|nr:TlpA disulfide reductase family protein [Terriglobia bacterium]
MAAPTAKQTAIPFDLSTLDGNKQSLQDGLAKGPVLLAFFKVDCPTCQFAFPFLERIHQHFRDQGIQIWGVSQDTAPDTRKFSQTFGVTFPLLLDEKPYKVSAQYQVQFVPSLFLVTPDGQVEISGDGFAKQDLLGIQKYFSKHFSIAAVPLFRADEKIPEFKPG